MSAVKENMRFYKWFVALLLLVSSASLFGRDLSSAVSSDTISSEELTWLVNEHLKSVFNAYLRGDDLKIENLFCTPIVPNPFSGRDEDLAMFTAEADFSNYPLNGQLYHGRISTRIAIRTVRPSIWVGPLKIPNPFGSITYEVDKSESEKVTLKVNDTLNDQTRAALIRTYVNQRYNRPLNTEIPEDKCDTFPDSVHSYVTLVLNDHTVKFLRVVFESDELNEQPFEYVVLKGAIWRYKYIQEVFSADMPPTKQVKKDIASLLFSDLQAIYTRGGGKGDPVGIFSGIDGDLIQPKVLEASNRVMKMRVKCNYKIIALQIDWPPRLAASYTVTIDVTYRYDDSNGQQPWQYVHHSVVDY